MSYNKVCIQYIGAIAQLGERCAGSAKVRGSSPLGSITLRKTAGFLILWSFFVPLAGLPEKLDIVLFLDYNRIHKGGNT